LQTHHYRKGWQAPSYFTSLVIVETLKSTKTNELLSLSQIADRAKTTKEQVAEVLDPLLRLEDSSGDRMTTSVRLRLAYEAVRHGAIQQVARALTWQEFEQFSEECLQAVGFDTKKGVTAKDDSRRWQLDVIAKKGSMILAIDCKHWESPGYESKLSKAAEHQKMAVQALLHQMEIRGEINGEGLQALPMIITLFEPRSRMVDGVVAVSVDQLADFLQGVSPYSSDLPFIHALGVAKSSIS
jgi:restriction endonuclease